jgi:ABC-2 type transport system permease protein
MTDLHSSLLLRRAGQSLAGTKAVFRHELRLFLFSPLSYLFQLGFLATLAAFVFLAADFYSTDEASIGPMLLFLPWVSLILVPALAMRTWVDDHNDTSIELALTLPVNIGGIVLGKFFAGYLVLLITLVFTLPLVVTVYYLGDPDPGVLFSGYLASAFLLAAYYALSLFAASLAREPVGAFVIGITLLFFLLLLGWDVFDRFLGGFLSASVMDTLSLYSPKTWFDHLSRGLIDFGGVFYFFAISFAALCGTALVCNARRQGTLTRKRLVRGIFMAAAILALLAVLIPLGQRLPGDWDLTAEHEFTLHKGTFQVLDQLPDDTQITLYWSANESSVPATIKSHAVRVREVLKRLVIRSRVRLTLKEIAPEPDTDEELLALSNGVKKIPMSSGDSFYLGLVVQHGTRLGKIPYLDIRRDQHLEYDIAVTLNGLTRTKTPKIGILSPLIPSIAAQAQRQGMSFLAEMKNAYDIAVIPHFKTSLPDGLDVLVMIDASILRAEMLYAIDQFVMKGGSLVVMIDPYLRFNRSSNAVNPSPSAKINDVSDLLLKYGVRYQGDSIVGDAALASMVADKKQVGLSFPFWMRVPVSGLSRDHPTTADLNEVFMVEAGALELLNKNKSVALITSTDASGVLTRTEFATKPPRDLALAFKPDNKRRIIAASLQGPFDSAFNGPQARIGKSHLTHSTEAPVIFVVADVDWMFDPFSLQSSNVGGRVVVRPLNDNLSFFLNMIEYASGDEALIEIRSRGKLQRPFSRVAELFKSAERQFRAKETGLASRAAEIEGRIAQYFKSMGTDDTARLPNDVKQELNKFRLELLPIRRELRTVRRQIRNEIDSLGRHLTVINLLAGPLMVMIFSGLVFSLRRRRKGRLT